MVGTYLRIRWRIRKAPIILSKWICSWSNILCLNPLLSSIIPELNNLMLVMQDWDLEKINKSLDHRLNRILLARKVNKVNTHPSTNKLFRIPDCGPNKYYLTDNKKNASLTTDGISRRLGDRVVWRGATQGPPGVDDPVNADPALLHDHQAQHHGQYTTQDAQQEEEHSLRDSFASNAQPMILRYCILVPQNQRSFESFFHSPKNEVLIY